MIGVRGECDHRVSALRSWSGRWRLSSIGTSLVLGASIIRGDLMKGIIAAVVCAGALALLDTYIAAAEEDPEDDEL